MADGGSREAGQCRGGLLDARNLVVLCPTLGRPHLLEPLAKSFAETTPKHRLLFIINDPKDVGTQIDFLLADGENYAAKINAGVRATTEDLILLAADDVKPHVGWFEKASALLSDTIGFVSLNDLGNPEVMNGSLATFPLVARWYIEKYGDLLHEGYLHNCVDVEATELAKKREAFAYCPEAVMEHMHPSWGKGEFDRTYQEWAFDPQKLDADNALLRERRKQWA